MTIIQKLQAGRTIAKVAKQYGISTAQCRAEMAACIADAWATSDPEAKQRQVELVGEDRIPTPEEFIVLVAGLL